MRMFSRRRGSKLGVVATTGVLALVLAACGGGSGGGGGGGESKGNLVVGTTDSVKRTDPAACYSYYCSNILQNAGNTLYTYKGGTDLVPSLATEKPKISDDGLTYTIPIRKGVTFHDGSKMTAKDVKFSLNRAPWINHPEGAGFLLDGIEKIDTPDPHTVVIHLKHPDITFGAKLAYQVATIVPSDTYKSPDGPLSSSDDPGKYIRKKFIGTGPYKVTDFRPNESITLTAYDDYWGQQPKNHKVLVKFYEKSSQLLTALKSDQVDVAWRGFTPEQRDSLQNGDINTVEGKGAEIRYIVMNPRLDPVDSVKVRKAIAAAMDRKRIVKNVLGGAGTPLYSMVPSTFDANKPVFKKQYDGKKPSDFVDGKVKLTLWYSTNHYGPTEPKLAQSVARMLKESGSFDVTLKSAAWSQFTEDAWPGKTGQYQAFLLGWYPDYMDVDDYVTPFYSCDGFLSMYCNDKMTKLIKKEQTATDPTSQKRMETFSEIQQLSAEDVPLVPLYVDTPMIFTQSGVQGVKKTMGPAQIVRYSTMSSGNG